MNDDSDQREEEEWYEKKSAMIETLLGKEHDMVMHSVVPYALGGGLDLYYYPHGIEGTGVATKELSEAPGEGSTNDVFQDYELVMFTRHPVALDDAHDASTPFGRAHHAINAVLNCIAPYSAQATLNPNETCEFPPDMEEVGGKRLIFDAYGDGAEASPFGLLLLMEIHPSEVEYARENGGDALIAKLKEAGYYPYSDMDRPPVA